MKRNNPYFLFACLLNLMFANALASLRPVPWLTHKAIIFLDQFMKTRPNAKVLEFGSGSSTLWFAQRTKNLVSVEHAVQWFDEVGKILNANPKCFTVKRIFHTVPYYSVCEDFTDNYFDLILVDGRNRNGCIKHAIRILKRGGVLMLDNAERPYYQPGIKLLEGWKSVSTDQPEPDSCGFTYPGWRTNWYTKP